MSTGNPPQNQTNDWDWSTFFKIHGSVVTPIWLYFEPYAFFINDGGLWQRLGLVGYIYLLALSSLIALIIQHFRYIPTSKWGIILITTSSIIVGILTSYLWWAIFFAPDTPVERKSFMEVDRRVVIEAENYSLQVPGSGKASAAYWEIQEKPAFSNGSAVQALPQRGVNTLQEIFGPSLIYQIEFSAPATYLLDIKGSSPSGSRHDSIHIGLSGKAITITDASGTAIGFSEHPSWVDFLCAKTLDRGAGCIEKKPLSITIPEPGLYNLHMWMREDGVVIDKIILTTDDIAIDSVKDEMAETAR